MGKKECKKEKLKQLKKKQKENRLRNKELGIKREPVKINYDSITIFDGPRGFILSNLEDLLTEINKSSYNDEEILKISKGIYDFLKNTYKKYNYLINIFANRKGFEKKVLRMRKSLSKYKYNLNASEIVLVRSEIGSIILEYLDKSDGYEGIDYGAIKVAAELCYRALIDGVKNIKISLIKIDVAYDDCLVNYEIKYSKTLEKHNVDKDMVIYIDWNPLDKINHFYTINRNKYIAFEESSIKNLATAEVIEENNKNITNGQELVSYNGLALNYLTTLERELIKLVRLIEDKPKKNMKLVEAINVIQESNLKFLSDEEVIIELNNLRKLRNKLAHGESIDFKEFEEIKNTLINNQIFAFISFAQVENSNN